MSWFEGITFAPNIPSKRFEDINEALIFAENLNVTPNQLTLAELVVNSDATIGIDHLKITRYGFEKLCTILGIPKPFAQKIPNDLLFENIRRLKQDNAGKEVVILSRDNGEIASIVKAPYKELSYGEMISIFEERQDLRYIDLGERYLTICIAFDDTYMIGMNENDTIFVGSFCYGSIVKETQLHITSGLYRTLCSNSFVCPFLGTAKANYKHIDPTLMLSKFGELIRCYNQEIVNRISLRTAQLPETYLYKHELAKFWNSLSKIVTKSVADQIVGFGGDEDRKTLLKEVKAWQATNKQNRIEGKSVMEMQLSSYKAYTVLNNTTEYAKDLHEIEKRDVEKLAGTWIKNLILN
jgi:hypothetical protein